MKKYLSFFRLRLNMGMQYRTAAAAGMVTQFVWGIMEVLALRAELNELKAALAAKDKEETA